MSSSSFLILFHLSILSFSFLHGAIAKGSKATDMINGPFLTSKLSMNSTRTLIVSKSGKGGFTSIQDAINEVPKSNSEWIVVHVHAGIYREKIVIPENKPCIFMRGNGKGKTSIVWNDSLKNNSESATFTVKADNFIAFGISFKNDASFGVANTPFNQSVATKVTGDKVAFYHCGFYSNHNTLFDHKGRHYYESCYIQGNIDFIFGRGQSIFQSCEIFVLADQRTTIVGSITAQNRQSPNDSSGFVFIKCKVYGFDEVYLGRAKWAHSRVIFAESYLSKTIAPTGWTKWSYDGPTDHLLYGEHSCYGPGANPIHRVQWSRQLAPEEVAPFVTVNFINGHDWLPTYYN